MAGQPKKEKHSVRGAGIVLWKASNAWQRHVREELKSIGITQVQLLLLETIRQCELDGKTPSQSTLSKVAGTDVMMTSKVIRTLMKQKLVARKVSKTDARSVVLQLTTEGKKTITRSSVVMQKAESDFFSNLVAKPHKFMMNLEALAKDH
jgi:hypothetical protein